MRKRTLLLFFLLAYLLPARSQYFFYNERFYDRDILWEAGAGIGGMNCLTDLGGKKGFGKNFIKDLNMGNTRLCNSIYLSATLKNVLSLRLETTFGMITAFDSILKKYQPNDEDRYRFERNLSFRSKIFEIMLVAEFHPLFLSPMDEDPSRWSPYLLAGIGFMTFNPEAKLNGRWYELHPLHTEGQGFAEYPSQQAYQLQQIVFPLGLGVKYEISPLFNARMELVHRQLFTDYLDDVSTTYIDRSLFANYLGPSQALIAAQLYDRRGEIDPSHIPKPGFERGDPTDNDSYFTFQIRLGYTFRQKR